MTTSNNVKIETSNSSYSNTQGRICCLFLIYLYVGVKDFIILMRILIPLGCTGHQVVKKEEKIGIYLFAKKCKVKGLAALISS